MPEVKHQSFLPGFELVSESEAAELLNLDLRTLRDARSGRWQGVVPYQEHKGVIWYELADVLAYLNAVRKRRRAGNDLGSQLTHDNCEVITP